MIAAYDAQGNHRTGTPVDNASAEWLAKQVQEMGAEAELEPFPFNRVDPKSCYLQIADRRIEGVPFFDAAFTDGDGVRGKIGPLGSDAEIGLAETEPFSLMEPRRAQAGVVAQARRSPHKAVVLLTGGTRPGLFLLNAVSFRKPSGPPTLQVSSVESRMAEASGPAARRGNPCRTRGPDACTGLQCHHQDRWQRPDIAAARVYGAAKRVVAKRERARQPACLLA